MDNGQFWLGIDYGTKKIGLATSDAGIYAKPFGVITNKGDKKNVTAIREILTKNCQLSIANCKLVVGVALGANGEDTEISLSARRFGELLHQELDAQVVYQNERYTSVAAEQHIRAFRSKELLDAVAACMILQSYMEKKKPLISDECITCGACADVCPVGAIELKGTQYSIDDKCIKCGECLKNVCPVDAIKRQV